MQYMNVKEQTINKNVSVEQGKQRIYSYCINRPCVSSRVHVKYGDAVHCSVRWAQHKTTMASVRILSCTLLTYTLRNVWVKRISENFMHVPSDFSKHRSHLQGSLSPTILPYV